MLEPTLPSGRLLAGPSRTGVGARTGVRVLNTAAIILLGLYFGRPLLVPFLLAVLLAFVLAPLVRVLQRARLGSPASVLLAVTLAFGLIGGMVVAVGNQAAGLADELPLYRATIQDKVHALSAGGEFLGRFAQSVRDLLEGGTAGAVVAPADPTVPSSNFQSPGTIVVVRAVLAPLLGPVATAGIVVVFTIFILLYREDLRDRLVRVIGRRDLHRTILTLNEAARRLSGFFLAQVGLAVGFGLYVGTALWAAGLPAPFLWGLLAGMMRFVPFVGSAIALIPPLLLAMAVSPGWGLAAAVAAIMLGGDLAMGQVVEPLTFSRRTGVSPLALIVSTAFWAFLWGPVGLLIATPLTVCLVVFGRHVPALSLMHVMLSDTSPLDPDEIFYQRALEGKRAELLRQATVETARTGLVEYFDAVVLGGLTLAQSDLSRDELDFERLEKVHADIETVLAGLDAGTAHAPARAGVPADWTADGAILFIPGRGPLDDLTARMGRAALAARGFGTAVLPNSALGSRSGVVTGVEQVRLCCLAVLDEGSSAASIQFFLRRMERAMPGVVLVVGLWRATGDSATLAALRTAGGEELIVRSLGELLALAGALAVRAPG